MVDRPRRTQWFIRTAAFAAIGAGLLGCSSGVSNSDPSPAASTNAAVNRSDVPSTTVDATRPASTVVTGDAPSTVPSVDGAALLQGALATMVPGYHFTTTLSVDGAIVLTADGDRVGEGTRLGVVQDSVAVQYVITPAGTWVKPDNGEWQLLATTSAPSDPIAALASPTSVAATALEGTATLLDVVVPAASLGLAADAAPLTLAVRVDNGTITSVGYTTTVDGRPAVMQAAIGPVVDGSAVVAPI